MGVTAIDCSTGGITVRVRPGEVTPFDAAVMVVLPAATPVASPALLMVAAGPVAFQVAVAVRFCVLLSE